MRFWVGTRFAFVCDPALADGLSVQVNVRGDCLGYQEPEVLWLEGQRIVLGKCSGYRSDESMTVATLEHPLTGRVLALPTRIDEPESWHHKFCSYDALELVLLLAGQARPFPWSTMFFARCF